MAQFLSKLRSRWRWLIGLLLGLLVLVAVLPAVCQYDPARRWLLGAAFCIVLLLPTLGLFLGPAVSLVAP